MRTKNGSSPVPHKTGKVYFKVLDEEQGIAEMFVSVFNNVDHSKERVRPGFFSKSLQKKLPKGVWGHDWNRPIAKTLSAEEVLAGDARLPEEIKDLGGLLIQGHFNLKTQDGAEMFSHLQFGSIDEFSFGYSVEKSILAKDGVRDLLEGTIYEWSPVLVGCNPATQYLGGKSFKGTYLGDVEEEMTWAGLRALQEALFWGVVYDALFYNDDQPLDQRLVDLEGAFNEFRDYALHLTRSLLSMEGTEEGRSALSLAQDSLKTLWPHPDEKRTAPDAAPFSEHLQTVLATVDAAVTRAEAIQDLRAKDGRALSPERLAQLNALKARLDALTEKTTGLQPPAERVDEAKARALRAQWLLRENALRMA